METINRKLAFTVLWGGVIPGLSAILLSVYCPEYLWVNNQLHDSVELLGIFAGLSLAAALLLLKHPDRGTDYFLWAACALIFMGILNGFHVFIQPGNGFIWLRSMASLGGGVLFALVWLPAGTAGSKLSRALPWVPLSAAPWLSVQTHRGLTPKPEPGNRSHKPPSFSGARQISLNT
jgi:hypothetical protein